MKRISRFATSPAAIRNPPMPPSRPQKSVDTSVAAKQTGRGRSAWIFLSFFEAGCKIDIYVLFNLFRAFLRPTDFRLCQELSHN